MIAIGKENNIHFQSKMKYLLLCCQKLIGPTNAYVLEYNKAF
jgi:hypothetical protein